MARAPNHTQKNDKKSLLLSALLLSLYFIYLLLRIDPKLIYQSQEPVFFFDHHFMAQFLHEPGGLNDLLSRFFSQFFYHSWTGALLLVFIFWRIAWNMKGLLRSVNVNRPLRYLHVVPSVFLLALHSHYNYPLVFTLGILWILISLNIYVRFSPSNWTGRILFYVLLHTLLYYLTANQVFIFAATIVIYEILYRRKIVLPIICVLYAGTLPWVAASTVFIISIQDAYRLQFTFYDTYQVNWLSWLLYAFFPLVLILKRFEMKYIEQQKENKNAFLGKIFCRDSKADLVIRGMVFLALVTLVLTSFEKSKKVFLQIDYCSHFGEWEKVLDMAKEGRSERSVVESQTYRALYHTGRLCDELFRYTRHFGGDGLFMHSSILALFPRQHSDLFFDLGILNESEHWAYEAVAAHGETPWNLQRLVLVNMLEGHRDVAARYLEKLRKTLWHRTWAGKYQKVLADTADLTTFPQFKYLKNALPENDFLVSSMEPKLCLEEMLQTHGNKMAFEYYMAQCLLEGDIGHFIEQIYRLNEFNYSRIPRHFEEAILIYIQLTGKRSIGVKGLNISDETIRQFIDFNQILTKYDKNAERAYKELEQKYRHTYWFYALYQYKPKGY